MVMGRVVVWMVSRGAEFGDCECVRSKPVDLEWIQKFEGEPIVDVCCGSSLSLEDDVVVGGPDMVGIENVISAYKEG